MKRTRTNQYKLLIVFEILGVTTVTAVVAVAQMPTVLFSFNGVNGSGPSGVLVQGTDGNIYGTTGGDGTSCGTVYKVTPSGTLTTLHNFRGADGCRPYSGVIQATDGNFYGTTYSGGSGIDCTPTHGCGTIFRITPGGRLTVLHSFSGADGAFIIAGLIQASDGNLYGTTASTGSGAGNGSVYRLTLDGAFTTVYSFPCAAFPCPNGVQPDGSLFQALNGRLYGTTTYGGLSTVCDVGCGTIFDISLSGAETPVYSFSNTDGASPYAPPIQAVDGTFYGVAQAGGNLSLCANLGCGTIYQLTQAGMLSTLHTFDGTDGDFPIYQLAQGTDGNFYGACEGSVNGDGTLFQMTPSGTFTLLYTFTGGIDGGAPEAVIQGTDGNFYGVASTGGSTSCFAGCGTIFTFSMGLRPFVKTLPTAGSVGDVIKVLGTNLDGTTSVMFNGKRARFTVVSASLITATVPPNATTGYLSVLIPAGTLSSNVPFIVLR